MDYDGDPANDRMVTDDYRQWIADVIGQLASLLREGGTLWWLCPAEDGWWTWNTLRNYGPLLYGKPIIWHERFSQYQKHRLTSDYRLLFPMFIPAGPAKTVEEWGKSVLTFNPDDIREESERQRMGDKRADPRGRVPGHVWRVRRLQGNAKDRVDWHPAQLPPEPLERIIKGWSNEGDLVMDAFAGSGSMAVVAQRLGRRFIGVEQSAEYCQLIRERLDG